MLVREFMSAPVTKLTSDESFHAGLRLMQAQKLRRLPVVNNDDRLVGIVTERDLSLAASRYLTAEVAVEEIMEKAVLKVAPNTPIAEAASLMVEQRIGGLPVVDAEEHVLGIITESDIFRILVNLVRRDGTGEENVMPEATAK